jgi:hypothetical protein
MIFPQRRGGAEIFYDENYKQAEFLIRNLLAHVCALIVFPPRLCDCLPGLGQLACVTAAGVYS